MIAAKPRDVNPVHFFYEITQSCAVCQSLRSHTVTFQSSGRDGNGNVHPPLVALFEFETEMTSIIYSTHFERACKTLIGMIRIDNVTPEFVAVVERSRSSLEPRRRLALG